MGAALALFLTFAAAASADSFDTFKTGSVDGQFGWKATGPYDQQVVDIEGDKKLRVSNRRHVRQFRGHAYSAPVDKPAGENADSNVSDQPVSRSSQPLRMLSKPGLVMSVSPTNWRWGSYELRALRGPLRRRARLLRRHVEPQRRLHGSVGSPRWIVPSRTRSSSRPRSSRATTTTSCASPSTAIRSVCGTTWENYYRFSEQNDVAPSDRLMWRLSARRPTRAAVAGKGFLFDDVTSASAVDSKPAVARYPVGLDGPAGDNGRDGMNGAAGATGPVGATVRPMSAVRLPQPPPSMVPKVKIGATKRTLHVRPSSA
jgi:hypothetical protein